MQQLRRITVYIEEPAPGAFHWMIIESPQNAAVWEVVEASMDAFGTWTEAWNDGADALSDYVTDAAEGPRTQRPGHICTEDDDGDGG